MADLFGGDYAAAMSYAQTVIEDDPAYTAEAALPELIQAAVRAGDYEAAATAHKTLSERALAAGTPWALGLRARCEALLAEGADAEGCYLESISQLKRCRMAVDLARAHLLYGQWLRRAKRRRDARQELRTAHDMFAAMGADRLAEWAAAELRATGERARARTPETAVDLTRQETRVADLAAAGASDSEIAAQLFISPSTVDYHLRKVFRKLNVTSRTQLAGRLKIGTGHARRGFRPARAVRRKASRRWVSRSPVRSGRPCSTYGASARSRQVVGLGRHASGTRSWRSTAGMRISGGRWPKSPR